MRKCEQMILCVVLLCMAYPGYAQNLVTEVKAKVIPMHLNISNWKTSNLIFPYGIKSVDRGSRQVLVQKAKGVENILQVKAATDSLRETNLTVVCADGTLYSFIVGYQASPAQLNFSLGKVAAQKPWALFGGGDNNEAKLNDLAARLTRKMAMIHNIGVKGNGITLSCTGLYVKDEIMYIQLGLQNNSSVGYTIDQLHFYLQDLKKTKRTASQQVQINPLYIAGNAVVVDASSRQTVVVAVPKFSIPDEKVMVVEMMEKNGGRNLKMYIKNRHLVGVIPL